MTDIKRCSKCKRYRPNYNFGLKLNGAEYKTCSICRNKKFVIITDSLEPCNNTIELINITNEPLHNTIEPISNTIHNTTEPTDDDDLTFEEKVKLHVKRGYNFNKLNNILSRLGYQVIECDDSLMETFLGSKDDEYDALSYLLSNQIAMILAGSVDIAVFLPLDNYNISILNVNDISIFGEYIQSIRYTHKKRCEICSEKQTRIFKQCPCCNNSLCHACYKKIHAHKVFSCPFCRHTLKDHVDNYITKHQLAYKEIIKYNAERI